MTTLKRIPHDELTWDTQLPRGGGEDPAVILFGRLSNVGRLPIGKDGVAVYASLEVHWNGGPYPARRWAVRYVNGGTPKRRSWATVWGVQLHYVLAEVCKAWGVDPSWDSDDITYVSGTTTWHST